MLYSALGITSSLGVVAPVLTMVRGIPQGVRVFRGDASGVSRGTWLLAAVVAELWLAYGFVFGVPAEVAANAPNLCAAVAVVLLASRADRALARSIVCVAGLSIGVAVVSTVSLTAHAGWVLAVPAVSGSLCLFLPQLARVLRDDDLDGVSVLTWLLALATAVSWGIYGLRIHQLAIWLPSVVMVPSSAVIAARVAGRSATVGSTPAASADA